MHASLAGLLALAVAGSPAMAKNPRHPGVEGPPEGRLSFTLLGPVAPGKSTRMAVKWTGPPGERITAWYDGDGDGQFGDHEVIIASATLDEPITVLDFEAPRWARSETQSQLRIEALDSGGEVVAFASPGGHCEWQEGFSLPGLDDNAHAFAVFDDGSGASLYVGGWFTTAGGVPANHIARWDGSEWSPLSGPDGNGMNGDVRALAVFDDGSGPALYAGGFFTSAGGITANRIARWDGSGWSPLLGPVTNGMNGPVRALAVFDDGTGSGPALYAGGGFGSAGDVPANRIARWDGVEWSALFGPTANGVFGDVHTLAAFASDSATPFLIAGGAFTNAGGITANRIARWDGTRWWAFSGPSGNGMDNWVLALAVFDDDSGSGPELYAGGLFTAAGGTAANRIARWDGIRWWPLSGPSENGMNSTVNALAVFDDGSGPALYAGGSFISTGGITANRISRWDGTEWSPLLGPEGNGTGNSTTALAVFNDGTGPALYGGGAFVTAGGIAARKIARWDGETWAHLSGLGDNGVNSDVNAIAVFDDGSGKALYVGGWFGSAGGVVTNRIARWDGSEWSALVGPVGNGANFGVNAIASFDDGEGKALYAGGVFTSAGGITANRIARWDGTEWSALVGPSGNGTNGTVRALVVFDDGNGPALYAGGSFTRAGGLLASNVARWDGNEWSRLLTPFGAGTSDDVNALAVFDDGSGPALYAGGSFTSAGGINFINYVARWDGNEWSSLPGPLANGTNGEVHALAVFDDGSGPALYAGGSFTSAGGITANRIARWDGTEWSPLSGPSENGVSSTVRVLSVLDDGSGPALYAGGSFTSAGGTTANRIARWDGAEWIPLSGPAANGTSSTVEALAVFDNGAGPVLYAGGLFQESGGVASSYLAQWSCSCECSYALPADQWRMLSLPCNPESSTVEAVFGDDLNPGNYGSRWILYRRNVAANSYQALGLGSELDQGAGYWIKTLDGATLNASGGLTPTVCPASSRYSSCFDIPLVGSGSGLQNLSGYPFTSLVDWAEVRFVGSDGVERTPSEAHDAGLASRIMYKWTGGAYEPFDDDTPGMEGDLDEWDAIWVRAFQNVTLRVPTAMALASGPAGASPASSPESTTAVRASAAPRKAGGGSSSGGGGNGGGGGKGSAASKLEGWYVRIIATGDGLTNRGNVLGQLSDASDGLDHRDLPELAPFSTPYLTVVFPRPEWGGEVPQYASDFRALRRNHSGSWDMEVRSDDPTREVTLELQGPDHILRRARLIDLETGERIRLHHRQSYTFTMSGTTRELRFEIPGN